MPHPATARRRAARAGVASLVVTLASATLAVTASPSPAAPAAPPAASAAAPAAPESAGSASGFLVYVIPDGQPTCAIPLGLNASTDPAIDRAACAFTEFQVSGATGTVVADLYAGSADEPFATGLEAVPDTTAPGTYQVSLEPDADWPAGVVRLVPRDAAGPLGELVLLHNTLRSDDVDAGAPTAPGVPFTVTGTVEQHSARRSFRGGGVPAAFTLAVTAPDGATLFTQQVTADDDGTFSTEVPAAATAGLTEDAGLAVTLRDATYADPTVVPAPQGQWAAEVAGASTHVVDVASNTVGVVNSFVSSVGWVKPGQTYPSTVTVTNDTDAPATPTVALTAPAGTRFTDASGPGSHPVSGSGLTWTPGAVAPGGSARLVLTSRASTVDELDTVVWRDLSSTAVLTAPGQDAVTSVSHGPKVIPPSELYETARYGDRPFPIVPVQYTDRSYLPQHSGEDLERKINDPDVPGSTFNLFQEMSLGQLFPRGTVPSAGIGSADFDYAGGFEFQGLEPGNTCTGVTYADSPVEVQGTPLYPERITNGVYNLPGQTQFYGADSNGSAVIGGLTGVGALQAIDSGCGPTGKLVHDAAALADPETDYSDFDTDKDGIVDFFMVVYAGCGGNGSSQLGACTDAGQDAAPYDNIWPHSSSLEGSYRDPVTGLPGYATDDQLKDLEGNLQWWTDDTYTEMTDADTGEALKVLVRVGPYNVNPETAIDKASVISHEYGHSLGLPDFYSTGNRETYGDWNLMATDKSQNMDAFSRQEMGWVVPEVLEPGTERTVTGFGDSKTDTGTITWRTADGTPYTLTDGPDGVVHNSEMYVAKLPGRTLLDAAAFEAAGTNGVAASQSHLWWSGSGNDFGCAPTGGRNFDLVVPGLSSLPAGTPVELRFNNRWDIEWDYDYGYVLTTTDGGASYTSNPSEEGYTTSNTDPLAANPNAVGCQTTYDNGLTGTSGSYDAGTEAVDRKAGNTPDPVFLPDRYDISELAGAQEGALRLSYATDPGLARPGWFVDDVEVVATVDGVEEVLYRTDFETSGDPIDPHVYNGGCRKDLSVATSCTLGWKYLEAGAESAQDHAYYLEMRDRSGFDLDGKGEIDRDPIGFEAGLSLVYTDEAHGYGNAGTDDPPAQSPIDSVPQPGESAPNLDDAAFTTAPGRSSYSEAPAAPHVDNYLDPSSASGSWEFGYDCLAFDVTRMEGQDAAPAGNLRGDVTFDMGTGCGEFDHGYVDATAPGNTPPVAAASAAPTRARTGQTVRFSAAGTTDDEDPSGLDYSWSFGDGGSAKDATGMAPTHAFPTAGTYEVVLTVTDARGAVDTASVTVVVSGPPADDTRPTIRTSVSPSPVFINRTATLSAARSSDDTTARGDLRYTWDRRDGGRTVDATGPRISLRYKTPGARRFGLTVTDEAGNVARRTVRVQVYRYVPCNARSVTRTGDFRVLRSRKAIKGVYCGTTRSTRGTDGVRSVFRGDKVEVLRGLSRRGGTGVVLVDGRAVRRISFEGRSSLTFRHRTVLRGFGPGRHRIEVRRLRGRAYVEGFLRYR